MTIKNPMDDINDQINNKINELKKYINKISPFKAEEEILELKKVIENNKNQISEIEYKNFMKEINKLKNNLNPNISLLDNYILNAVDSLENLRKQNRNVENIKNRIKSCINNLGSGQMVIDNIGYRYENDRRIMIYGILVFIIFLLLLKYYFY